MSEIYPYLLTPAYKDYVWGGSRIPKLFGRDLPSGVYAESWEMSDRPEGPSTIRNGPLAGKTLREAVARLGSAVTGAGSPGGSMPLLIKLIDAAQNLSVQVHPHDTNAHLTGGEPKTEMWYVIDAAEDARIYAGLKPGTTPEIFHNAINNNSLEQVLNTFTPVKGDVFFIPGGRVHAIGAGCLLLEVQQNSNTTYRVYDWGRVDAQGRSRPLHIDEAMKVINFNDEGAPLLKTATEGNTTTLVDTEWFTLKRIDLANSVSMKGSGASFHSLFAEEGSFRIITSGEKVECEFGETCLLPAAVTSWSLEPKITGTKVLIASVQP